jgi:hypothetical protein
MIWSLVIIAWVVILCTPQVSGIVQSNQESHLQIAISLTTIPSRFATVHHTIRSWIAQTHPIIRYVFVFVPPSYRRFRKKKKSTTKTVDTDNGNFTTMLHGLLSGHDDLRPLLENGTIQIVSTDMDYGPITRVVGALQLIHRKKEEEISFGLNIDYWVFCDDDVGYDTSAAQVYSNKLSELARASISRNVLQSIGLTLFAESYRLAIPTSTSPNAVMEVIPHIQGVDSYLVNHMYLSSSVDLNYSMLSYPIFIQAVTIIHRLCPSAYYQDDYVVAVLLYLGGIRFRSVWESYRKLVHHIDGVSTSHFQMHLDPLVFQREQNTKQCLPEIVPQILQLLSKREANDDAHTEL